MQGASQEKEFLREQFKDIRSLISENEAKAASEKISNIFFENITLTKTDIISGYYPINDEMSPIYLFDQLKKKKITTSLPVVTGSNMPLIFREWQQGEELVPNKITKVQEPKAAAKQVNPTIILVPMLAFDENGYRLGYGGGFFDRTIRNFKKYNHKFITVGIAYERQKTEPLPLDAHDQRLDYIITEEQILQF